MANLDYDKIHKKLEAERKEAIDHIANLTGPHQHMNPDRDDLAQDFITLEKNEALKALELEQLEQIESALKRLKDGTYGLCVECGQGIPVERLEILPYATLCVICQSKNERRW